MHDRQSLRLACPHPGIFSSYQRQAILKKGGGKQ
jgi:hypothetical protein